MNPGEMAMPDKYMWDKALESLEKSVQANQSSAQANTRNAYATEKLQGLVRDQNQLSENLLEAVEGLKVNTSDIVKGLQIVASNQQIMMENSEKEKQKYFKYLTYAVLFIIIILGGGAALKVFLGLDLSVLL